MIAYTPAGASSPDEIVSYSFDALGRKSKTIDQIFSTPGQLSATVTTSYSYDAQGNLTSTETIQQGLIASDVTVNHVYDPATGLLMQTNTSDGALSESYAYDIMGRLQTVTVTELNGQVVDDVTSYTYDADGNLHTTVTNTGSATLTATNTYDDLDRLLSLVNTDAHGTVISSYTYTRNAMGDITEVDESGTQITARTVKYQYDALERLTSETDTVGTTSTTTGYTYDLVGNRLTQTDASGTTTFCYNADDQLKKETAPDQTVTKYDYDLNGSLKDTTSMPPGGTPTTTASYTYDARNRLVSAIVNNQQESLAYDDDGNRIASSTTASSTATVYENDEQSPTGYSQVLAEKNAADGTLQAAYAWGQQLIAQARPAGTSVYLYDGHGSVRALANTSGRVTDTYVYDAFGNLTSPPGSTPNVYLYAGQRFDAILGQYDLRARDYDPSTGRFSTMDDPRLIGGPGDLSNANLYLYVGGNPINGRDPTGHSYASQFGTAVHNEIAADFRRTVGDYGITFKSIFSIVKVPYLPSIGTLLPDLVYLNQGVKKEVFEIKPDNVRQIIAGYAQLAAYVIALNKIDPTGGWTTGSYSTYRAPVEVTTDDPVGFAIVTQLPGGLIVYDSFQDYAKERAERTAEAESAEEEGDFYQAVLDGLIGGF